jgi:hypothetical protein
VIASAWDYHRGAESRVSVRENSVRFSSNHPQTTNIVHAGPTICLGGTHVDS